MITDREMWQYTEYGKLPFKSSRRGKSQDTLEYLLHHAHGWSALPIPLITSSS